MLQFNGFGVARACRNFMGAFLLVAVSVFWPAFLQAQEGQPAPLGQPVSASKVGQAREIPARLDFHVLAQAPYSRFHQGIQGSPEVRGEEAYWQGLEADMVRAFVRWMQATKQISLAFDPMVHADPESLKKAMLADPVQAAGILVGQDGTAPVADTPWQKSLPWLRSRPVLLVPVGDTASWASWKYLSKASTLRKLVVHQSPMTAAWFRDFTAQNSPKYEVMQPKDEFQLWKMLGKGGTGTYGVVDAGTASYFLDKGEAPGWRVRVPEATRNTVRYLVFPQGSLFLPYWEEFLSGGWGWMQSNEFKSLMNKHLHPAAQVHVRPVLQ